MRGYKRISFIISIVMFLSLINLGSASFAGDAEILRGLEGIDVVVEYLKPEIERDGLLTSTLRTDFELKLRMAGIKVLSKKQQVETAAAPYVYLNIQILKSKSGLYATWVSVELNEMVMPIREYDVAMLRLEKIRWATTYKTVGIIGITPNLNAIRTAAKDEIDKFINTYLSVNPK
jgi:hypothetical protein